MALIFAFGLPCIYMFCRACSLLSGSVPGVCGLDRIILESFPLYTTLDQSAQLGPGSLNPRSANTWAMQRELQSRSIRGRYFKYLCTPTSYCYSYSYSDFHCHCHSHAWG